MNLLFYAHANIIDWKTDKGFSIKKEPQVADRVEGGGHMSDDNVIG
jgi:hypothetical protein